MTVDSNTVVGRISTISDTDSVRAPPAVCCATTATTTAWLERELIAARQDPQLRHIFVVMHHPPFSISLHGGVVSEPE